MNITALHIIAFLLVDIFFLKFIVSSLNRIYRPWKYLKPSKSDILVSVLIPARNEAKNITKILQGLLNQSHKNLEIIVYDDQSEDQTAEIIHRYSEADSRVKLIKGSGLPDGWLGKNNACHQLSKEAQGQFLCFIDADVSVGKELISKSLELVRDKKLEMLSIFPQQILVSTGEKIVVPIMNFILLTLLPLMFVHKYKKFSSFSAANGQFIFIKSDIYKKYWLHEMHKNYKTEDIAIARFLKRQRHEIACLAGVDDIKCRMYNSFNQAVDGFSKNITDMLGGSYLVSFIYWAFSFFSLLFLIYNEFYWAILISLILIISTIYNIVKISKENFIFSLIFSILRPAIIFWILIISLKKQLKKDNKWKGRNIYR